MRGKAWEDGLYEMRNGVGARSLARGRRESQGMPKGKEEAAGRGEGLGEGHATP